MLLLKVKSAIYRSNHLVNSCDFYEIKGKDWKLCVSGLACFRTLRNNGDTLIFQTINLEPSQLAKDDLIWVDSAFLSDKSLIEIKKKVKSK